MPQMTIEEIEVIAKDVMEDAGSHSPQLMLDTDKGIQVYILVFEDNKQKDKLCEKMRSLVNSLSINRYWLIMETWVGNNPMIRPSNDKDRTEALLIQEFRRDLCHATILNKFTKHDKKIVWGERNVVKSHQEFHSQWNFFVEDACEEVFENMRIEYIIEKLKGDKKYKQVVDEFREEEGREITDADLRKALMKILNRGEEKNEK